MKERQKRMAKNAAQGDFDDFDLFTTCLCAVGGGWRELTLTSCMPCKRADSSATFPRGVWRKYLAQIKKAALGDFNYLVFSALLVEVTREPTADLLHAMQAR